MLAKKPDLGDLPLVPSQPGLAGGLGWVGINEGFELGWVGSCGATNVACAVILDTQ